MNPYIKQFPDLMSGKKIMYVHGFLSSAQSGTVKMLQELMPNATLVAEDIPVHPEEAIEMLQKMAETEQPDLIIGTSMGGMYTELLKGFDRILVNPAFEMGNTMSSMTGKQEFQNPRKDGVNELMVTKGLIKEYRDFTERCFQDITPEEQQRVYMKATSSMHKAYEMLIEHYNVYIVAQAPTNDHDYMAKVQTWVEEYLSTPAYNHIIFCNQKNLLYGDYFIDPRPCDGFMGTTIEYGSDEFKTFEEIITFFERLGGQ